MFELVQDTIKAIKRKLLNDKVIRQLLYNDSNNALNLQIPTEKEVAKYITTYPIYDFENKDNYTQHGMVNIFMTESEPNDEDKSILATVRINVVYNTDKWELVDGSCRPLAIADRIIDILDNAKLSVSNPIEYSNIQDLIISKKLVGYALLFTITDGNSDLENF